MVLAPELCVLATRREKLIMGAVLDNTPVIKYHNPVGPSSRSQAVGHNNCRALTRRTVSGFKDCRLCCRVECRGGFVEKHDARVIVVGTYGETPLRGAILGSVPHKLLHLSDRPVLCVPAER